MSSGVPSVLILGHSFVKRLKRDLRSNFDPRADCNFKLGGTVSVHLHGVGGRTVTQALRDETKNGCVGDYCIIGLQNLCYIVLY